MAGKCEVTGKSQMHGNKVSHSNRKSRRVWKVNVQKKRFWVPMLNKWIKLSVSAAGLRNINRRGIDTIVREMLARGAKL